MPTSPKKERRLSKANGKINQRSESPVVVQDSETEVQEDLDQDDEEPETEAEYEIEAIRNHRPAETGKRKGTVEYLIKWKGYPESDNTWEPEANTRNSQDVIDAYWKKIPTKSQKRKYDTVVGAKKRRLSSLQSDSDEEEETPAESSIQNGFSSDVEDTPRKSLKGQQESPTKREEENDDEQGVETQLGRLTTQFLDKYKQHDSWEPLVIRVVTMERGDDGILMVQLEFRFDKAWHKAVTKLGKTVEVGEGPCIWITNALARKKCAQKMLNFYEEHLRFSRPPTKTE